MSELEDRLRTLLLVELMAAVADDEAEDADADAEPAECEAAG